MHNRTVPQSLKLHDPDAALLYAKAMVPSALVTQTSLDSTEYRQIAATLYSESETLLPGMEPVSERESFLVKFGGKLDAEITP